MEKKGRHRKCFQLGKPFPKTLGGTKAYNLSELLRAGFNVPNGIVISSYAFCQGRVEQPLLEELFENYTALRETSTFPTVIVRSSATIEDQIDRSYAGYFTTVPGVGNFEDLIQALYDCCESMDSKHVQGARMGILVQEEVVSEVAGVAFTANPVTQMEEYVIESSWGQGESTVMGQVTPDRFYVAKSTKELTQCIIGRKKMRAVIGQNGLVREDLPKEKQTCSSLSDSERTLLVENLEQIEHFFSSVPQDVEWCFGVTGRLFILQSRPITTL